MMTTGESHAIAPQSTEGVMRFAPPHSGELQYFAPPVPPSGQLIPDFTTHTHRTDVRTSEVMEMDEDNTNNFQRGLIVQHNQPDFTMINGVLVQDGVEGSVLEAILAAVQGEARQKVLK